VFFVSVAGKGLSPAVSLLFATLAGKSISVAAKGVRGRAEGEKVTGAGREDVGGVRRTVWRASMVRRARRIVPT